MYPREPHTQPLTMRQSRWNDRANPNRRWSATPAMRQNRWKAMRQSRWSANPTSRSANPTSWSGRTNSSLSPNALDPLEPLELKVLRGPQASDSCMLHR